MAVTGTREEVGDIGGRMLEFNPYNLFIIFSPERRKLSFKPFICEAGAAHIGSFTDDLPAYLSYCFWRLLIIIIHPPLFMFSTTWYHLFLHCSDF